MAKIEDALAKYDQSNFDIAGAAQAMRALGEKHGLTEDQLAAAVPKFGDEHKGKFNSGYTEASNYNQIAMRAVQDAMKASGKDAAPDDMGFIDTGRGQAEQRWQATQKDDDDGLGSIFKIAATAAAMYFGGPMASSLMNGVMTLAQGGSVLSAISSGAMSAFTSSLGGAAGIDIGTSDLGGFGGDAATAGLLDSSVGEAIQYTASDAVGGTGSEVVVTAGAGEDMAGGLSDSPAALQAGADATGSSATGSLTTAAEDAFTQGAREAAGGESGSGLLDWVNKNKTLATGIGMVAGGVGKGLLDSQNMDKKIAGDERMLRQKIAADEALLDKKNQNTMELDEWRRKFGAAGQMQGKLPVQAPAQTRAPLRPNARPVYDPNGLLTSPT